MSRPVLDLGSTELKTEKVVINGVTYLLKEASGAAVVKYRNATISKARMKGGEVVGMDGGVADAEPLLVSMCLWQLDSDGKPSGTVPLQVITSWPQRIQKVLFDKVKDLSDLDKPQTRAQVQKAIDDLTEQLAELDRTETPDPN